MLHNTVYNVAIKPKTSIFSHPFISYNPAKLSSSHQLRALKSLNADAGNDDSVTAIRQAPALPEGEIPIDSFVAFVIESCSGSFRKMLDNKFCSDMAAAKTDDETEKVLKGFKWYMVQDYFYCEELMRVDAARASNAPTSEQVLEGAKHVTKSFEYAQSLLQLCESAMGIPKDKALAAEKEKATTNYAQFEVNTAQNSDWIASKLATIPCIQGYYKIAKKMEKESKRKDTVWYKNWVLPNSDWSYCESQIQWFEHFAKGWKDATPDKQNEWRKIFETACAHEVEIFAIGEHPKDI